MRLPESLRVVLLSEDPDLAGRLRRELGSAGHALEPATTVPACRELLAGSDGHPVDALLIDLRHAEQPQGWELLQELRGLEEAAALLVLGHRSAVDQRVRMLDLGADDFVSASLPPRELVARIRAIVRRTLLIPTLRAGGLRLDVGRRLVEHHGERIDLTPREFDVLRALVARRGRGITRDELSMEVWGQPSRRETTTLEIQICRLRRKLRPCEPLVIETLPGLGYRLTLADAG